jgi:hypothetical protein
MTCAICHKPVEPTIHEYWVGAHPVTNPRPADYTIVAPLYFLATPDLRAMRLPFCGPECSNFNLDFVKWYVRENPLPKGVPA